MNKYVSCVYGIEARGIEVDDSLLDKYYLPLDQSSEDKCGLLVDGNTGDILIGFIYICSDDVFDTYNLEFLSRKNKNQAIKFLEEFSFLPRKEPKFLLRILHD